MKTLQAKINGEWRYVFCRNERNAAPILTNDKRKALPAHALDYFRARFASIEFRTI